VKLGVLREDNSIDLIHWRGIIRLHRKPTVMLDKTKICIDSITSIGTATVFHVIQKIIDIPMWSIQNIDESSHHTESPHVEHVFDHSGAGLYEQVKTPHCCAEGVSSYLIITIDVKCCLR
jgi:hypothetical protein